MDIFIKSAAGILCATVCSLVLVKQGKDISLLLVMAVCALVAFVAVEFFGKIITFLQRLERLSNLDGDVIGILLKCTGIALLSEIVSLICSDSGNAALGRVLQMLSTALILWLSLPLFTELINLAEEILGSV